MWDFVVVSIGWGVKLPAIPCDRDTGHDEEKSIMGGQIVGII